MNKVIVSRAKSTHYAVSTFAAILYALVWLLTNHAHAETQATQAVLTEVIVTGHRESATAPMPEIIVWGKREAVAPTAPMVEVIVYGHRESTGDETSVATTNTTHNAPMLTANATIGSSWLSKARSWLQGALLK